MIYTISDVHLELYKTHQPVIRGNYPNDILIIAGDLLVLKDISKYRSFLDTISSKFKHVYWIPGNHEYWYSEGKLEDIIDTAKTYITQSNITFDSRIHSIEHKLIGVTLWTNFNNDSQVMINAREKMKDYTNMSVIPTELYKEHKKDLEFIASNISDGYIVFSHHAPTLAYIGGTETQYYYGSDLESFILKYKPKTWIHGHWHKSVDYLVGNTRVISNPHGYFGIQHGQTDLQLTKLWH